MGSHYQREGQGRADPDLPKEERRGFKPNSGGRVAKVSRFEGVRFGELLKLFA